jgi:hypothetical protein
MTQWNPLLVAVSGKKIDIVRYLLNDLHLSLSTAGSAPDGSLDARFAL